MHLRYANNCVLSLRVPITGIHILSGIDKSRPRPSGLAKLMGLLTPPRQRIRVKVPQFGIVSVKPQLNQISSVVKSHSR